MSIPLNVQPNIPEGALKLDRIASEKFKEGLSLNLLTSYVEKVEASFNEGQGYFLDYFGRQNEFAPKYNRKRDIPALWMLAHMYTGSDNIRDFLDRRIVSTSTSRKVDSKKGKIFIGHSIKDSFDSEGVFEVAEYGLVVPVSVDEYPREDLSLVDLINKFPVAARALFLMNDSQLNKFLERAPQISYNPERPACQGVSFSDNQKIETAPLSFGGRKEGKEYFLGITCREYVPVITHPIVVGRKDEITKTFMPEENVVLMRAFETVKKNPTSENINTLETALNNGMGGDED
jgi:hypothetical protein